MAGRLMRFVLVLSLLAGLVAALPGPAAVAAGRMGAAAPVNSVPEQPPVDLGKVSVGSRAVTELPPVGSPQRKDLDEVRAAADAAAARERTKLTQVHVAGAAAPVTSAAPATARVSCGDGGVPYDLRWQDLGLTAPPFLPTGGRQKLRLTMTGAGSLAAGAAYVSYHLGGPSGLPWVQYDGNPQQDITVAFGQGQTVDVEASLAGLSPGSHYVAWDVFVRGYGWLSEHGVCALGIQYNVPNRPPNITVLGPPNGGTSLSRTPTLAAVADDPDKYPNGESRYRFTMCGDQAMTASCRDSGWQDHWAYQVPDGYARWNETVWWKVEATDGALTTTSPVLSVTVVPPAPDRWRTVGSGLNLATVQGVVLPFGMYTRQSTDLAVATESAPKLEVTRGYSSAATVAGYVGAMGRGWLGLFDSQVSWDEGQQALTVTYPDGRQQVFGKNTDGSYASRLDTGSSNTVRLVGGFYEVQTGGGEVLRFAGGTGQLTEIVVRPAIYNKSLRLDRDGEGRVVGLTQLNSGRRMQVEWNPPGVDQGCRSRELLKAITTEAPQPGQAPTRIEYHYTGCDLLDEVCQIGVGCERYSYDSAGRLVGGTSRAGRPLDRVVYRAPGAAEVARVEVAADTAQGTDFQYFDLPPNDPEQQDYLDHVNRWAGRTVQTSDGKDQTYKFDELNRLIELDHVPVRTATTNYRLWNYSPYTGRLETFFNENFEVTHIIPNPNGDIGTRWSYRSPDHIVGVNYSYDYFADATDPRNSRMTSAAPYDEYTKPYVPETFAYADYHGLLQSRTPAHDTGTSVGAEQYSYTNGIGSPEDLLFSVTNGAGTTTYGRNAAGDVTELRNTATGARIAVERDNLGRMLAKVEYSAAYPQGARTTYRYDTAGNLSGVTESSTTDAVTGEAHQLVVDRVFDGDGRLRSETDSDVPASARWLAAHPGQADADPYIRVSSYQYAADGTLAELSNPNGAVYRYTYVRGQVATGHRPGGQRRHLPLRQPGPAVPGRPAQHGRGRATDIEIRTRPGGQPALRDGRHRSGHSLPLEQRRAADSRGPGCPRQRHYRGTRSGAVDPRL
ncbi:RHS repeat domain-containing protein [Amycolatopsis sp. NBC_01480]|uniref:RHS repeat domain-containing protein n=1 Tax=Amycolatopsis sp. NBC_01480 TaxID=2903562 RepID=UPI003FA46080